MSFAEVVPRPLMMLKPVFAAHLGHVLASSDLQKFHKALGLGSKRWVERIVDFSAAGPICSVVCSNRHETISHCMCQVEMKVLWNEDV